MLIFLYKKKIYIFTKKVIKELSYLELCNKVNFINILILVKIKNQYCVLTFLQFRPAFFEDSLIDIVNSNICKYVADMLGTTTSIKVDQFVKRLFFCHFSLPIN